MATKKTTAKKAAKPEAPVFQQVFKTVDDLLRKDAGCTSELDYTEQSSWLLFLKYLDALEQDREQEAKLVNKKYEYILDKKFRWSTWAAPRNAQGAIDYNTALTGEDLIEFVNGKLFPYLKGFKQRAAGTNTIEYKIGEIFDEVRNRMSSGYNLRDIIDQLDRLQFGSQNKKHELSDLYEVKIKNMGNAGRNGGEYYTPRPLIRAIINVIDPKVGDTVYDGAVGSAGFLCEAFEYMSKQDGMTTSKMKTLQEKTFYGKEKKSLAYVIAVMNMILHGIDAPNIVHSNTLGENIALIQEKDRYNVVLANPPFGGKERSEVQQNFPIKTSETAYLFLQHFIKILKTQGRGGVVIKNTTLSNADNASVALRRHLLETCNLHTILDLPSGAFQGAGVRTVVLFFDKGTPTKKIWYYQLNVGRNMGKTNSLNDADLIDFVKLQKTKKESDNSWTVDISDIDKNTYDLTVRNPNAVGPVELGTPQDILNEIKTLDARATTLLAELSDMFTSALQDSLESNPDWPVKTLGEVCDFVRGVTYDKADARSEMKSDLIPLLRATNITEKGLLREDFVFIPKSGVRADQKLISGDALITIASGSASVVGRSVLVEDPGEMTFGAFCGVLRPGPEIIPRYLSHFMSSRSVRVAWSEAAQGTNINNLKRDDILQTECPLPPLDEQKRIVARLDSMKAKTSKMVDAYDAKLTAAKNLRQSILEAAFAGDL